MSGYSYQGPTYKWAWDGEELDVWPVNDKDEPFSLPEAWRVVRPL
jgi:hypothetical protein